MSKDKSPQEMVAELYTLFSTFKKRIEDPDYIHIEKTLDDVLINQNEMKEEIRELKRQLLNPFDGVIVENKKNSESRIDNEKWKEEFEDILEGHKDLVRWKSNVIKISLWAFGVCVAVISFLASKYIN